MGKDESAIVIMFAGFFMSAIVAAGTGYYLYNDGLRCLFIKDDLACAQDQTCHWVTMPDTELKDGRCVPRRYYQLGPDENVRRSTGCAILGTERECNEHDDDDCVWNIADKMCTFHPCGLKPTEIDCGEDDACSWNATEKKCRKQ
jgi:hypothetical protein